MTIKDVDERDLGEVARRAADAGMSTQEYLRRVIAREANRPMLPHQLAELAERHRSGRTPMPMDRFATERRRALRG